MAPWLRPGITVGFISGGVWLVYNLVNNLGDLSGGQNAALSVAGLGVTVSLFTLAGFRGSARTGRVRTGALTGLWAALVSSTVGQSPRMVGREVAGDVTQAPLHASPRRIRKARVVRPRNP